MISRRKDYIAQSKLTQEISNIIPFLIWDKAILKQFLVFQTVVITEILRALSKRLEKFLRYLMKTGMVCTYSVGVVIIVEDCI
jgi:hypothetical protein